MKCSWIKADGAQCGRATKYTMVKDDDGSTVRKYDHLCKAHRMETHLQETCASVIKVDGTRSYAPPAGAKFTLAELQSLVGGQVQVVPSGEFDDYNVVLADEEGLVKQLLPNQLASDMVGRPLVGTVLVVPTRLMG